MPRDFAKHGFTQGCPGCTYVQNGMGLKRNHSEDSRKIMKLYLNDNVSKLLGHSSMKITQDSYGKIVDKKISMEMNRLRVKAT